MESESNRNEEKDSVNRKRSFLDETGIDPQDGITIAPPDAHGLVEYSSQTVTTPIQPVDNEQYGIDTEYCIAKSLCKSKIPDKSCYCDRFCGVLNDCCEDAEISRDVDLQPEQFSCLLDKLMVVTRCGNQWTDETTRALCENESDVITTRVRVSDRTDTGFTYKNMYCAYCNYIYDFEYWALEIECIENGMYIENVTDFRKCHVFYRKPKVSSSYRVCTYFDQTGIISTCSDKFNDSEYMQVCTNGNFSKVYSLHYMFRNKYCAMCNGHSQDLYCEPKVKPVETSYITGGPSFSFRMLVDFNSKRVWRTNEQFISDLKSCNENEFVDPFSNICTSIQCPPKTFLFETKCIPVPDSSEQNLLGLQRPNNYIPTKTMHESLENISCSWTKLDQDEFEVISDTDSIMVHGKLYNNSDYVRNETSIFLCLHVNNVNQIHEDLNLFHVNEIESYLTFVGLIISVLALSATLFVYLLHPSLLNMPGKILTGLVLSLLIAQILYLIAPKVVHVFRFCQVFAVLMHFCFLCSFCWMNVLAFDLWMTFSQLVVARQRTGRFIKYTVYAIGIPFVIVLVSVCVNFLVGPKEILRPGYGEGVCWITSKYSLLLYFAGPLAIFKVFDFIAFGYTVYYISIAKRPGAVAMEGRKTSYFLIYLKLSLTMGLTWLFAFIANFTNNNVMWYMFIIFNTLQGLFIAASFLCTKRVLRLLKEKKNSFLTSIPVGTSGTSVSFRS